MLHGAGQQIRRLPSGDLDICRRLWLQSQAGVIELGELGQLQLGTHFQRYNFYEFPFNQRRAWVTHLINIVRIGCVNVSPMAPKVMLSGQFV